MSALSPKRCCTSARMMAVISSGVHEGPQPPPQHAVSAGKSNTSMVITGSGMVSPIRCGRLRRGRSERIRHSRCIVPHRPRTRWLRGSCLRVRGGSPLEGTPCAQGNRAIGHRPTSLCERVPRASLPLIAVFQRPIIYPCGYTVQVRTACSRASQTAQSQRRSSLTHASRTSEATRRRLLLVGLDRR